MRYSSFIVCVGMMMMTFRITPAFMLPSFSTTSIMSERASPVLTITEFYQKIETRGIRKILGDENMEYLVGLAADGKAVGHVIIKNQILLEKIIDVSIKKKADLNIIEQKYYPMKIVQGVLQSVLYIPLIMVTWSIFSAARKMMSMSMPMMSEEINIQKISNITWADWAGSPEVVRECVEVASFLTEGERYAEIGATLPRGILLEGPPGTGKTLLARAMAGMTNSTFLFTAGSEFVQVFVGVGAMRIRQLFIQARENRPCIIFIDEIDAIGRKRSTMGGTGSGGGNDEREQTLNQLLVEMDGFQDNTGVIVIAATNRKDMLDEALIRPGRLDRIIHVPLPDRQSRLQILKTHARNRILSESIGDREWKKIALITEGFSGADLQNVLNEAAILSVRRGEMEIGLNALYQSVEKKWIGIPKEMDMRSDEVRRRVAVHEVGHAMICLEYPEYFILEKITIQETYEVGGYTMCQPRPEILELGTRDFLKKRLCILLGGKAAEALVYGEDHVSTGASADLQQGNKICQDMIAIHGMGDEELKNTVITSSSFPLSSSRCSAMDRQIEEWMHNAYEETRTILEKQRPMLNAMVEHLLMETTIYIDKDEEEDNMEDKSRKI